ncbi:MAG: hypothetical protein MSC31_15550 [Solirubrobacteraceae bacterium MAG38_C4-C5]|nr:hypothetical protein [Candidatus Siliceabacter maunaloa]
MWLLTPRGFYSVVANHDDPETVLVRARVREDLEQRRASTARWGRRYWGCRRGEPPLRRAGGGGASDHAVVARGGG